MTTGDRPSSTPLATVRVRDVEVAMRRRGEGEPLLYLHGAYLTGRWLALYDHLADRFDVLVPDHPGFGATPRPAWLTDMTDVVLHYDELLDALGLDRVHLVGHSLGGWFAAELAAFYPRRVASLTLIAPAGLRPEDDEPVVDLFRLDGERKLDALLGSDAARWTDLLEEGDPVAAGVQQFREATTAALLTWNPRYDLKLERRLARVSAPAQVLVPEQERLLPRSIGRRYSALIPGARLVTVAGTQAPTQHLLVVQEPARIADLVGEMARPR